MVPHHTAACLGLVLEAALPCADWKNPSVTCMLTVPPAFEFCVHVWPVLNLPLHGHRLHNA
jgi:hypothetical protein